MKEVSNAVRDKAGELLAAQAEVARIEDDLKRAKERVETIAVHEMPEIMEDAGVEEFTTSDGVQFIRKESIFANLKAADRERFFAWCESNGCAGLIKSTVEIPFGRKELDVADALIGQLAKGVQVGDESRAFRAGRTSKIEPTTLRKWAKDRLEAGDPIPEDLVKVQIVPKVEVKTKK